MMSMYVWCEPVLLFIYFLVWLSIYISVRDFTFFFYMFIHTDITTDDFHANLHKFIWFMSLYFYIENVWNWTGTVRINLCTQPLLVWKNVGEYEGAKCFKWVTIIDLIRGYMTIVYFFFLIYIACICATRIITIITFLCQQEMQLLLLISLSLFNKIHEVIKSVLSTYNNLQRMAQLTPVMILQPQYVTLKPKKIINFWWQKCLTVVFNSV